MTVLELDETGRPLWHAAGDGVAEACDGDCDGHRTACGVTIFYPAPLDTEPVTCPRCLEVTA